MKSNTIKKILVLTLTFVVAIGAVPALADTIIQRTDSQIQVNRVLETQEKGRNFVDTDDVQPFDILLAVAPNASTVQIYFDRALDETTVANLDNYEIKEIFGDQKKLTITGATFYSNRNIIELTVSGMEAKFYTLKTFNLLDAEGNPQKVDLSVNFPGHAN